MKKSSNQAPKKKKNCFKTDQWYQTECAELKALNMSLKNIHCLPFDYTTDNVEYLYTLSDDDLREKAKLFGLQSYDLLNKEYAIRTISIKSLSNRFEDYKKGQQAFNETIRSCSEARMHHFESCKNHPGWKEDKGHEFARKFLVDADKDCQSRYSEAKNYVENEEDLYKLFLQNHQKNLIATTSDMDMS